MQEYAGSHIWIVGASSGIGRALAIELSARGAALILTARRQEELEALNKELGSQHKVYAADAADAEALRKIAQTIPRIDSVIFMAAIYAPHTQDKKSIEFIHDLISVNLGGAFNVVNAVLPVFIRQNSGQIVLCGSVAGYRGLPQGQPYCATKAAIINYAESLKIDLGPKNIDVKVINPGFVRTPLTDKNDFMMPMMIEADEAARAIARDLISRKFEIHFPKKFTWIMKFLKILPASVYFFIMRQIKAREL